MAISYSISYTFSPSTTISSSQVNQNFSDNANTWTGIEAKTKTFSNLGVDTQLKSAGTIESADGLVGTPGITFSSDTDNGFYRSAANVFRATAGGADVAIFRSTGVAIVGTTTNDSPATGYVGEVVSSTVTSNANFPSTTQYGDLTSISLTAGDWVVSAFVQYNTNTSTSLTNVIIGITTTSGNSSTGISNGDTSIDEIFVGLTSNIRYSIALPMRRFSIASTTTHYLKYNGTYSNGQPVAVGRITAVRIR